MKCCICQAPATRHSQSDNPSHYCDEHGRCGRCGESVELFVPYELLNGNTIYVCLCVKRPGQRPSIVYPVKEKKQETLKEYWSA